MFMNEEDILSSGSHFHKSAQKASVVRKAVDEILTAQFMRKELRTRIALSSKSEESLDSRAIFIGFSFGDREFQLSSIENASIQWPKWGRGGLRWGSASDSQRCWKSAASDNWIFER